MFLDSKFEHLLLAYHEKRNVQFNLLSMKMSPQDYNLEYTQKTDNNINNGEDNNNNNNNNNIQ